ncbi:MAG: HEPN domain-containing protein [Bacteroidota bacterium]|nr:HEPN domain-containing protein [Bacteroidota bacterium]MDP3431961.1 HEPN domain-containing protein [Bacteroidota bacterium]
MAGFLNQYEIFYNKAKADLSAANVLYANLLAGNSDLDFEIICFHLQQCAEKMMKAVLSKNQIYYPRIHDLETIYNLLKENGIVLDIDLNLLIALNDYAVEGRYAVMNEELDSIKEIFTLVTDMVWEVGKIIR